MKTVKKKPALVLTRVIDAPRKRVFNAWIEPKQFAAWWGPHHFTAPKVKLESRPGGKDGVNLENLNEVTFTEKADRTTQMKNVAKYLAKKPQGAIA